MPQANIPMMQRFLVFSVKLGRARISSMALKYLYNSAALLALFIEEYEDMTKARAKKIIGRDSFLSLSCGVLFLISQNRSMAMSAKEYTEFAQG